MNRLPAGQLSMPLSAMYPVYQLPAWMADEQQLRDEAVLFGLSEARPDEKILSIRLAFAALTASLDKQIEQHQERLTELNGQLTDAGRVAATIAVPPSFGRGPLAGFGLGVGASLLLCAGTYLAVATLIDTPLALLMAGLMGLSGCVGTGLVCLVTYRNNRSHIIRHQTQTDATLAQQQEDRAAWQREKQTIQVQLSQAEALLTQQLAHRDVLIQVFESEFDLARSLRHRLRDQLVDL